MPFNQELRTRRDRVSQHNLDFVTRIALLREFLGFHWRGSELVEPEYQMSPALTTFGFNHIFSAHSFWAARTDYIAYLERLSPTDFALLLKQDPGIWPWLDNPKNGNPAEASQLRERNKETHPHRQFWIQSRLATQQLASIIGVPCPDWADMDVDEAFDYPAIVAMEWPNKFVQFLRNLSTEQYAQVQAHDIYTSFKLEHGGKYPPLTPEDERGIQRALEQVRFAEQKIRSLQAEDEAIASGAYDKRVSTDDDGGREKKRARIKAHYDEKIAKHKAWIAKYEQFCQTELDELDKEFINNAIAAESSDESPIQLSKRSLNRRNKIASEISRLSSHLDTQRSILARKAGI